MRLDAGVRRQSTRVTIINGPQPALAQASDGPCRAVERAPHSWKAAHPWPGPRTPFRLRDPAEGPLAAQARSRRIAPDVPLIRPLVRASMSHARWGKHWWARASCDRVSRLPGCLWQSLWPPQPGHSCGITSMPIPE
jgi:hypothetical protein